MGRRMILLAALALALAACGGTSSTPLTASQLARKIPGCHALANSTPDVLAVADVTCTAGSTNYEVVTFASMANEVKWIQAQGPWYGCCVEGHLWAADYNSPSGDGFPPVIKALGGRQVSG